MLNQQDLSKLSHAELIALLQKTQIEQRMLKSGCKVSEKKAVSVYGLGRLPVTLYKSQWEALFARVEEIKLFIKENESILAVKQNTK